MIIGIIFVVISIVAFYVVCKTDLENASVENESFGRFKLYVGIIITFGIGIISILRDLT